MKAVKSVLEQESETETITIYKGYNIILQTTNMMADHKADQIESRKHEHNKDCFTPKKR
jgi:hypothetical protein